jgi:hypothetical protein
VLSRFSLPNSTDGTGARLDEELAAAITLAEPASSPQGVAAALAQLVPEDSQCSASAGDWQLLQACIASDWNGDAQACGVWGSDDLLAGHLGLLSDAAVATHDGAPGVEHQHWRSGQGSGCVRHA